MRRANRSGASMLEFALILPVFVALMAAIMDVSWFAFQRSALASSVAIGCRTGAIFDPGFGDSAWDTLELRVDTAIRDALAATASDCDSSVCTIEVTSFGTDPGRSLSCSVRRDVAPLTRLFFDPLEVESTIVVRMEWQR